MHKLGMVIILIGNYHKDKQESMIRYSNMLYLGFLDAGYCCKIWTPPVIFGRLISSTSFGLGKWMSYLDKFIVFPIVLRFLTSFYNSKNTIYHICDHSNSIYLPHIYGESKGITCHDVLAIRGALGYSDAYCDASFFGKLLQKWILNNLKNAKILTAASEFTLKQLNELSPKTENQKREIIYQGFNANFSILSKEEVKVILSTLNLDNKPYILCVGSSQLRKNRIILVRMLEKLGHRWEGVICFAGEELDDTIIELGTELNLLSRIVSIKSPNHETLVALYKGCEAFIFPSFSEGFGMPLIEAQACGAPVIASSVAPMPEISGDSAIHVSPDDSIGFAEAFLKLKDIEYRERVIFNGFENIKRFDRRLMIDNYLKLYN